MKVMVGSTNPVKIKAARKAFKMAFPEERMEIRGMEVDSGVPEQPVGDKQIRQGAINRAWVCLAKKDCKYGVGLEGGVIETEYGMMESAWACVVDDEGVEAFGGGMHFMLPEKVAERIRNGGELGPVMDELTGRKEVKKANGAVGVLSRDMLSRSGMYVELVKLALIRFVGREWYEG